MLKGTWLKQIGVDQSGGCYRSIYNPASPAPLTDHCIVQIKDRAGWYVSPRSGKSTAEDIGPFTDFKHAVACFNITANTTQRNQK